MQEQEYTGPRVISVFKSNNSSIGVNYDDCTDSENLPSSSSFDSGHLGVFFHLLYQLLEISVHQSLRLFYPENKQFEQIFSFLVYVYCCYYLCLILIYGGTTCILEGLELLQ